MKLLFSTINHTKSPSTLLQNVQQNPHSSFTNSSSHNNHSNVFKQSTTPFIPSITTPFSSEVRYNMVGRIISANSSGCQSCSSKH
jgi:hypothetical protein